MLRIAFVAAAWKPNTRDCAKEQLAGVTDKAERERRAAACLRRGEFKPSSPKTF
jgi:entry exclusion lipoprotein TrbK